MTPPTDPDPRIIRELIPESPRDNGSVCYSNGVRAGIEWAAEKANISDMIVRGAAGQYIYDLLAAHDAAMAEREKGTQ